MGRVDITSLICRIIKRLFRNDSDPYIYGTLNGMKARLNKKTKVLEFVLWEKGHGGRSEDYWHQAGYGHEANFIRDAL